MVFKEGEVVEYGTFDLLLSDTDSVVSGLSRVEDDNNEK